MKRHRFVTVMHYTESGDLIQRIWSLSKKDEARIVALLGAPHSEVVQPATSVDALRQTAAASGATLLYVPSDAS